LPSTVKNVITPFDLNDSFIEPASLSLLAVMTEPCLKPGCAQANNGKIQETNKNDLIFFIKTYLPQNKRDNMD
jgi:hypothetical protein